MEAALLEGMTMQARLGKCAGKAFKKEAWTVVLPQIQVYIDQTDENGISARHDTGQGLREAHRLPSSLYMEWRLPKEASGFGWKDQTMPTAPDNVWRSSLHLN
jgi:hypothetical protein